MYAVYDLMTDKVKDYKKGIDCSETTEGPLTDSDDVSTVTFSESKVNLYRYGGFALHSLLKNINIHKSPILRTFSQP